MTLLLTRDAGQNRKLLDLIDPAVRQQLSVLELPLLQILALPLNEEMKSKVQNLDLVDHIIFVSQNAAALGMEMLESYWPQWPLELKWYAVGGTTAEVIARYGIDVVVPHESTSEGLLALPALNDIAGTKVLIVRGKGGRTLLEEVLVQRGAEVKYLEVYERHAIQYPAGILQNQMLSMAVVMSGEALAGLSGVIGTEKSNLTLIVPSRRLEDLALESGFDKVLVTSPDVRTVAQAIESLWLLRK